VIDGNNFSLSVPTYGELDSNNMTKVPPALISISNRTNVMVKNVTFVKYSNGIEIQNSSNIIILQNNMRNGNNGIYIDNSTNCSIVANQITNNPLRAIFIRDCTSFNVSYNTISNSQDSGIVVD
jgi:parallel beta-helix repeat protein